jgi:hypothetical protein
MIAAAKIVGSGLRSEAPVLADYARTSTAGTHPHLSNGSTRRSEASIGPGQTPSSR